jgi:hypothetical protein
LYPPVDIRRVADDSIGRDLADLNALADHMPADGFDCIANMLLWHADSYAYVEYLGGRLVSPVRRRCPWGERSTLHWWPPHRKRKARATRKPSCGTGDSGAAGKWEPRLI